jgi:Holliday junction resolvasome RuvABC endonuclease subunit
MLENTNDVPNEEGQKIDEICEEIREVLKMRKMSVLSVERVVYHPNLKNLSHLVQ